MWSMVVKGCPCHNMHGPLLVRHVTSRWNGPLVPSGSLHTTQKEVFFMNLFEQIVVQFFNFLGPGVHGASSASSQAGLFLGLF